MNVVKKINKLLFLYWQKQKYMLIFKSKQKNRFIKTKWKRKGERKMVKVAKILKNKLMVAAMLVVMVLGTMAIPSHA